MNFLHLSSRILNKLVYLFRLFCFYIKKPFYVMSYNCNGNKFVCKGVLLNSSVSLSGRDNAIIVEGGVKINNVKISVSGQGNQVIIRKNAMFCEGGRIRVEDENNVLDIGDNSILVDCFFSVSDSGSKITIGKDCLFSAKVIMRNSDTHSILDEHEKRTNPARDTVIGDRVWIGYGANVLKGCRIGDDCIIGTQSVVAGVTAPNGCVIAGVPAKIVKQGVHWTKERL